MHYCARIQGSFPQIITADWRLNLAISSLSRRVVILQIFLRQHFQVKGKL